MFNFGVSDDNDVTFRRIFWPLRGKKPSCSRKPHLIEIVQSPSKQKISWTVFKEWGYWLQAQMLMASVPWSLASYEGVWYMILAFSGMVSLYLFHIDRSLTNLWNCCVDQAPSVPYYVSSNIKCQLTFPISLTNMMQMYDRYSLRMLINVIWLLSYVQWHSE